MEKINTVTGRGHKVQVCLFSHSSAWLGIACEKPAVTKIPDTKVNLPSSKFMVPVPYLVSACTESGLLSSYISNHIDFISVLDLRASLAYNTDAHWGQLLFLFFSTKALCSLLSSVFITPCMHFPLARILFLKLACLVNFWPSLNLGSSVTQCLIASNGVKLSLCCTRWLSLCMPWR